MLPAQNWFKNCFDDLKNPRTPDTTEKNISKCAYMCGVWPVILTSHPAFTLLSVSALPPKTTHHEDKVPLPNVGPPLLPHLFLQPGGGGALLLPYQGLPEHPHQ